MNTLLRNVLIAIAMIGSCVLGVQAQQQVAYSESKKVVASPKMDIDNHPLLQKYAWARKIVNCQGCNGESVSLYYNEARKANYVIIVAGGKRVMYDEQGRVHCTDLKTLDCTQYYELVKQPESWFCNKL